MDSARSTERFSVSELRLRAAWIRDDLDPGINAEGSRFLDADSVLDLDDLILRLQTRTPSLEDLQISRIHRAIVLISDSDRDTRWPSKLVEMCERLRQEWVFQFGPLDQIRVPLYGPGGRLHGIIESNEHSRRAIEEKWVHDPNSMISAMQALEHGDLQFKPGQWWIHPIFAFRDGIISSSNPRGGITFDTEGAYAITLTATDEVEGSTAERIIYAVSSNDPGKHRLFNSFLPVKTPVRVLRTHTLYSKWSPVVGIRYEGLYKIVGFGGVGDKAIRGQWNYTITLQREADQVPMTKVLRRPYAEEIDDYWEYKRLREPYEHTIAETVPRTKVGGLLSSDANMTDDILAHVADEAGLLEQPSFSLKTAAALTDQRGVEVVEDVTCKKQEETKTGSPHRARHGRAPHKGKGRKHILETNNHTHDGAIDGTVGDVSSFSSRGSPISIFGNFNFESAFANPLRRRASSGHSPMSGGRKKLGNIQYQIREHINRRRQSSVTGHSLASIDEADSAVIMQAPSLTFSNFSLDGGQLAGASPKDNVFESSLDDNVSANLTLNNFTQDKEEGSRRGSFDVKYEQEPNSEQEADLSVSGSPESSLMFSMSLSLSSEQSQRELNIVSKRDISATDALEEDKSKLAELFKV